MHFERPNDRSLQWDEKYRKLGAGKSAADPFLAQALEHVPGGGRALDLACGAGRHTVELARRFDVVALDLSAEALRLTRDRCSRSELSVETRQIDLEAPEADLGRDRFDLAAAFYFLHRPLMSAIARCAKPGGFVVYKTFTVKSLPLAEGPRTRDYLLEPGELPTFFPGWRVITYEEESEGRGTAALLAQKPELPPP